MPLITNILRTVYSIFTPFIIKSIQGRRNKQMILPANGKTMLLLLLGFLIRLRRKDGATTDHPKPNLASGQFIEPLKG
jgi:hypothetical protein